LSAASLLPPAALGLSMLEDMSMMESRKRPSSVEQDGPALKKRAVESPTGAPTHTNGASAPDDDDPPEDSNLEV